MTKKLNTVNVNLWEVKPNPYRHLDEYTLIPEKVEKLVESIKNTHLWANMIGRKSADGEIEIAYGHHRLAAAKVVWKNDIDKTIPIHIQNLSDDDMLIIMADENSEDWANSVQHRRLSVTSARDRIEQAVMDSESFYQFGVVNKNSPQLIRSVDSAEKYSRIKGLESSELDQVGAGMRCVAAYLGWGDGKVREVWDLLNMSPIRKKFSEELIAKAEASGDTVESTMTRKGEEKLTKYGKAKEALAIDAAWDSEAADNFGSLKAAREFKDSVVVRAIDNGEEISRDVVVKKAKEIGGGKASVTAVRQRIENDKRQKINTAEQAKREALREKMGIYDEIRNDCAELRRHAQYINTNLHALIERIAEHDASNSPASVEVANMGNELLYLIDNLADTNVLTNYGYKRVS
jgi:hypothetical protein